MLNKGIQNDESLEIFQEYEVISNPRLIREQQKQQIKDKQEMIVNLADNVKLEQVIKMVNGLEELGNILTDEKVLKNIKNNIKTAKDLKFLSEVYSNILRSIDVLKRCDTDADGIPKRVSLAVGFQGVKVGLEIENK